MFATFIDDEETIKDLITGEIAGLISLLTSLAMTVAAFPEKLDNLVLMINDLKKELEMNDRTTNKSYFIDSLFDTLLVCASGKANGIDKDLAELYKKKINKQRASTDI